MPFTKNTNLVGDVRSHSGYEEIERFLNELEKLMIQYRVNKVDVAWSIYPPSDSESRQPSTKSNGSNLGINA